MYNTFLLDNLLSSVVNGITDEYDYFDVKSKIEKKDDAYYVHLPVPGLTKEDLKILVKENYLSISYKIEKKDEDKTSFVKSFDKSYKLPNDIDVDKIKATIKDGICTIKIPKDKQKSNEKLIPIS